MPPGINAAEPPPALYSLAIAISPGHTPVLEDTAALACGPGG
jgi:hypothetical protein